CYMDGCHVNQDAKLCSRLCYMDECHGKCPVTEYACAVWHPGLTKSQSHSLEALQRRAFRTILSHNTDYSDALFITGLPTLADRREELTRRLFSQIQNPAHCLHYLLPNKRD